MSESEEEPVSFKDVEEDISFQDRSEIESLKSSLISSLDGESVIETQSAPSSPRRALLSALPFEQTTSAPTSPVRFGSTVVPRTSSVKDLVVQFETLCIPKMGDPNAAASEAVTMLRQLSTAKGWITRYVKALEVSHLAGNLDADVFKEQFAKVNAQLDKLMNLNTDIGNVYRKHNAEENFKDISDGITAAINTAEEHMRDYADKVPKGPVPADLLNAMTQMGNNSINVKVECPTFNGDENDKLEFKNWLDQFDAIIKSKVNWTEEFKVTYLKTKVRKNAANFIAHLDPGVGVYEQCIDALKEQYLDEPFIIDEYLKKLCADRPEYDDKYGKTRIFIANTRNHLHNLKTHYEVDLMDESNNAHKLLSHIILSKFS